MGSGQECRPHHCCLSRRHGDRRQALAGSTRILLGRTTGVSVSRIGPTFDELARQGRRALIMYLTVGYPERESALELVPAILEYGLDRFCADSRAVGVDGLIVVDLPPEEAHELHIRCRNNELDLIFLLAPTSTPERIKEVAELASGFIYCVSLTGITGARAELPPELPSFLQRVRAVTDTPLAVGFGISEPRHAQQVAQVADGVAVGSALLNIVEASVEQGIGAVRAFVSRLRAAMDDQRSDAGSDEPG